MAPPAAWAPVLGWELSHGRPKIVVSVGERARSLLNHLIDTRLVPDPAEWGAWRTHIPHYVYVASRPDVKRNLPGNHWLWVEEYREQFAVVAQVRDALPRTLRTFDGPEYAIGAPSFLEEARSEIAAATGGGSGMGRWSYLFGDVLYGPFREILPPEDIERIAHEAADLLDTAGDALSGPGEMLLRRLAMLLDLHRGRGKPRRKGRS